MLIDAIQKLDNENENNSAFSDTFNATHASHFEATTTNAFDLNNITAKNHGNNKITEVYQDLL